MQYLVRFTNRGDQAVVEADSFHPVHSGGPSVDGSICVQFMRSIPNPRFAPAAGINFGVDNEPGEIAEDDWELRQRRVNVNVALYTNVMEILTSDV